MLSFSPDGKQLAVAGEDGMVQVWDVDSGKELARLQGHQPKLFMQGVFCAVAWSPDGKRLMSASPDRTFLLWDTATWMEILVLPSPSGRQPGKLGLVRAHHDRERQWAASVGSRRS
jgi:WD40 repeat protein